MPPILVTKDYVPFVFPPLPSPSIYQSGIFGNAFNAIDMLSSISQNGFLVLTTSAFGVSAIAFIVYVCHVPSMYCCVV